MATKWPDDSELLEAFVGNPIRQWLTAGRTRILLEGIEVGLRSPLTEPLGVPANLQIEHIMPVAWTENWPMQSTGEFYEEASARRNRIIHTIGNLTLLTGPLNLKMSNRPWADKREALAEYSKLDLTTKDLLPHAPERWDEAGIVARSRRLHEVAVRVWPSPQALAAGDDC